MDLPSQFLAIAGLILGLVFWYNHWRDKSKGMSPPEPSGAWPLIGHLHLLQGNVPVYRILGAMADKLGPVFVIRLGMKRALIVSSHEAVKECFTTNDKVFASRPRSSSGKLLAYNYAGFGLAPYGPLWREMRKLSIMEIFSTRRLSDLMHVQISELHAGIKDLYSLGKYNNWVNPKKVVMSEWFEHLNFNVVLMMIAGKRYFNNVVHGGEEGRSNIASIKKFLALMGAFVPSDVIPFLEWVDLQGHLSSMKLVAKEMGSLLDSWVEEHKGRLNSEARSKQDFIDVMLTELKDASLFGYSRDSIIKATVLVGNWFTHDQLLWGMNCRPWVEQESKNSLVEGRNEEDQKRLVRKLLDLINPGSSNDVETANIIIESSYQIIQAMVVAGSDTTPITSTWMLSALLNNRHVMKHAQEELDSKVGRHRWVEQSDIQNLVYLKAIVKESLRLYAASPLLLPHESMEDCHVGGYHIPKGTRLLVNAWKLHRDPAVWSNPEEFQPERFLKSHATVEVFGQHFELVPFGSGRRSCPGMNLALQMIHLTLARLLQGFDMGTQSNSPVDMTEGRSLTMPKVTPLEVMLTPRLAAELY